MNYLRGKFKVVKPNRNQVELLAVAKFREKLCSEFLVIPFQHIKRYEDETDISVTKILQSLNREYKLP